MPALFEEVRPATWDEFVGQERLVRCIQNLRESGRLLGRAYWVAGPTGCGKTSLAYLLAREVCDPDWGIEEIDATACTVNYLQGVEDRWRFAGMSRSRPGRCYIVNEAHGLRRDAVRHLLVMLERIPKHVITIFTTTLEGQESLFEDNVDAHPLLSRCLILAFARRGVMNGMAERCREIAAAQGWNGKPVAYYTRVLQECRNNMRAAIQKIEADAMSGDAEETEP